MLWNALERYRDHGLLLARVGFGLGFLWFHGLPKLLAGPEGWARTGRAMESLGITFGHGAWGLAAGLAEGVGGVLLAAGFIFRPVAAAMMLVMIVATANHHVTGQGTPAHSFKNAWLFAGFVLLGPGRFSLDHVLGRSRRGREGAPEAGRQQCRSLSPRARAAPDVTVPTRPRSGRPAKPPGGAAAWLLAVRLKTLPAAAAPVAVGAGLAAYRGVLAPLPALAALAGALLIQIATNLANDYYDFARGADTAARVGPVRVTQAGLLPPHAVKRGMLVALAAAFTVGIYLVWVGGWPIVAIGLASLVCAVAYTGGPFPLAYHGLGDLFVFVFFGLVAVAGTYYVQALAFTPEALWAGAGVGALSTAILVVNNLRDMETDARAGKRTLAVRLGRRGSQAEYVLLLGVAAAVPPAGVWAFGWPPLAVGASAAVALAAVPARRVLGFREPRELLPALGETARVLALYALALAGALAAG